MRLCCLLYFLQQKRPTVTIDPNELSVKSSTYPTTIAALAIGLHDNQG